MMAKTNQNYKKTSSDFYSQRVLCRGDLYSPNGSQETPIVIMAHGFAAERAFRLPAYAERFARAGLAVYLFDYRTFGDSHGEPRQYVDHRRHIQDWKAAIDHVRSMPNIDSQKIALWGTSYSAGHVIVCAARNPSIAAITIQVPFVDSFTTLRKFGAKYILQATPHAVRDIIRAITFRPPHYIKVIGTPDEFAALNTAESLPGYQTIISEGSGWENKCPARVAFTFPFYRPIASVAQVTCPALVMLTENDSLSDIKSVGRTAKMMPNSTLVRYPYGHFDIYHGEPFEQAVELQRAFLVNHLLG
jgi:pimeloyl-ACP methyl ester carboxylesterase